MDCFVNTFESCADGVLRSSVA